jgi:hypothetical protein
MRLVEFLIYLLEAQAETLKRLAAFFGEDRLLEMLESADEEKPLPALDRKLIPFESLSNHSSHAGTSRSPYVELEGAVREFGLPAVLEFHLWAYPYYRAFIESDLDLNSMLATEHGFGGLAGVDSSAHLIAEAVAQAADWVKQLPIPPSVSVQAEAAAQLPWVRFRTQVLKRIGRRPMGAVT